MQFQEYLAALRKKATEIRMETLKMIANAESGAVGSAMSCIEMLVALYYGQTHNGPIMNIDPAKPNNEDQDYFILSKINAAPAWYALLADLGYFPAEELKYFKQPGALLTSNPRSKIPGVPLSGGLAGQGVGGGVGLALALRTDRSRNKVFVMAGDAEMAAGGTWEALLQAGHQKLGNFILLIDRNTIQQDGLVRNLNLADPISDKLDQLGFRTINVFAGHDFDQLLGAYEKAIAETRLPVAIIAKTVKAKGVDFAENKSFYHDKPLSQEELQEALASLERKID
ncbi:transketolase [Candidatus Peregrinibacteria bacterium]|nr:transketolase [Candidatus Peregrinibacteria bacterium]